MNTPHNNQSPVDPDLDQLVEKSPKGIIAIAWTKDVRRLRKQDLDIVAVKNLLNNIVNRPYWTIDDVRMEARLMVERLDKQ